MGPMVAWLRAGIIAWSLAAAALAGDPPGPPAFSAAPVSVTFTRQSDWAGG